MKRFLLLASDDDHIQVPATMALQAFRHATGIIVEEPEPSSLLSSIAEPHAVDMALVLMGPPRET